MMTEREKVVKGLENAERDYIRYSGDEYGREYEYAHVELSLLRDTIALLKESKTQYEVQHAIFNVDIPDGVLERQFYSVMSNVSEALAVLYGEAEASE